MCNDYRLEVDAATLIDGFAELEIDIRFPEGLPNIEPRADIKITDSAPIVRSVAGVRAAGSGASVRSSVLPLRAAPHDA